MVLSKNLRQRIKSGEITSSVRIWKNARVNVGSRYPLDQGVVFVTAIQELEPDDLTDDLARANGFSDLATMSTVAQNGDGKQIFRVDFDYLDLRSLG
jgi:hypothetical protein